MTIPEIVKAMRHSVRPVSYGGDIVSATMPVPADIEVWACRIDEAYGELVSELVKLSRGIDGMKPNDCDACEPSDEYLKEYAESVDAKYPPVEGDDAWTEDARWDMDCCEQCGNRDCAAVKFRELVNGLKEEKARCEK